MPQLDQSLRRLAGRAQRPVTLIGQSRSLDPSAEHVEVESSHTGMSVSAGVYRVLARILDEEGDRWSG